MVVLQHAFKAKRVQEPFDCAQDKRKGGLNEQLLIILQVEITEFSRLLFMLLLTVGEFLFPNADVEPHQSDKAADHPYIKDNITDTY